MKSDKILFGFCGFIIKNFNVSRQTFFRVFLQLKFFWGKGSRPVSPPMIQVNFLFKNDKVNF